MSIVIMFMFTRMQVTAFHLYVLQYANPDFAQIVGYHNTQAAYVARTTVDAKGVYSSATRPDQLVIHSSHTRRVLVMLQDMMYVGRCAPCTPDDRPLERKFRLADISELFHFCHQNRMMFWLSNFREFLEAAVCHYGLGAAAMSCNRVEYTEFLEWLHKMQPETGITESVCLAMCIYYRHRWADRSGQIVDTVTTSTSPPTEEAATDVTETLTPLGDNVRSDDNEPSPAEMAELYELFGKPAAQRPWLTDLLPMIPHQDAHLISLTPALIGVSTADAGAALFNTCRSAAVEPPSTSACIVCNRFKTCLRRTWFDSLDHYSCGDAANDRCRLCTII
jgi:hypothetical protein